MAEMSQWQIVCEILRFKKESQIDVLSRAELENVLMEVRRGDHDLKITPPHSRQEIADFLGRRIARKTSVMRGCGCNDRY